MEETCGVTGEGNAACSTVSAGEDNIAGGIAANRQSIAILGLDTSAAKEGEGIAVGNSGDTCSRSTACNIGECKLGRGGGGCSEEQILGIESFKDSAVVLFKRRAAVGNGEDTGDIGSQADQGGGEDTIGVGMEEPCGVTGKGNAVGSTVSAGENELAGGVSSDGQGIAILGLDTAATQEREGIAVG